MGDQRSPARFHKCCGHQLAWYAIAKRRWVAGHPGARFQTWGDSPQGRGYSRAIAVGYIGYNLFNLHSSRITLPGYGLGAGVGRGEDGVGTGVM